MNKQSEEKTVGKNQKTGVGRALVKQHNQQSKENGRLQKKNVLESFTEITFPSLQFEPVKGGGI